MSLLNRVAAAMYEAPAPDDEPGGLISEWPPTHPDDLAWWITRAQAAIEAIQPQGEPSDELLAAVHQAINDFERTRSLRIEVRAERYVDLLRSMLAASVVTEQGENK